MNVFIYALGGGWGHLNRAAALAIALGPTARVRILANSPYVPIVQAAMPELSIDTDYARDEAADVLVVDTFPRGLIGELARALPTTKALKVLIHRDINPEYAAWAKLRPFVAEHFDLVVCPGEQGPFSDLPRALRTAPWLVRAPVRIADSAEVIVCAGGNADELPWYGEATALLASDSDVRCLAPELPPGCPQHLWTRYWPSVDWIATARAVVGGAGYNTINECSALGVPLIARSWPRKYDRQSLRAIRSTNVTVVETPEQAARAALAALNQPRVSTPLFINGAEQAAQVIRQHQAP